jgi:hypothetical protein
MKQRIISAHAAIAITAVASLVLMPYDLKANDAVKSFQIRAELRGANEVPPIATAGKATLEARVDPTTAQIAFELTYSGLQGGDPPLFAHIHFGPPRVNGGVMVFFCGGGGKPACPAQGTGGPVVITGVIVPTDVVGPTAQGINPGDFADVVNAIKSGLAYANIHTTKYPTGEIRGKVELADRDRD